MAFNKTNVNLQVVQKVVKASRLALKYPNTDIKVLNRKGVQFLFVRCVRFNNKNFFLVYDMKGNNVRRTFSCIVWKKELTENYNLSYFFLNSFLYPTEHNKLIKKATKKKSLLNKLKKLLT